MTEKFGGAKFDGLLSASVGLTYKFKRRGWDKSKTVVRTNVGEINALRDQLTVQTMKTARLRNAIDESNRNPKQEVKKTAASILVIFRIGRA